MAYCTEMKEIIKRINDAGMDRVPCFFIRGNSLPVLETSALGLAETMEEECNMRFKGGVKHFTIRMPYFSDLDGEQKFMEHLKESVSIAKDCYDSYCGLVLVEMDKEWCVRGVNPYFRCLPAYIKSNPQICFIVNVMQSKGAEYVDKLYFELSSAALWMKMNVKEPDSVRWVSIFREAAEEMGYYLSVEAVSLFGQLMETAEVSSYDVKQMVKQMLLQIDFDRYIKRNEDKCIYPEDIKDIANVTVSNKEMRIGFTTGR